MQFYEATTEEKKLIAVGRDMMDWSEDYGRKHGLKGVTDDGLRTLNNLSHVGGLLTRFGAPFGTRAKDFSPEDQELISKFMQKKVDIERR